MLVRSRVRYMQLARVLRASGPGDVNPRWTLPANDYHKYTYQPTIPDKHFNIGHFNYTPFTMWLRARRPTMERILCSIKDTVVGTASAVGTPIMSYWDSNLPGFGYKCMGFLGVLIGYNLSVMYWQDRTEAFMNLEKLSLYRIAYGLQSKGFFQSESEEQEGRMQAYNLDSLRLEGLFQEALQDATEARSFDKFISYLQVDENANPLQSIPEPISWRLASMPYGRDSPDSKVFDYPAQDKPASSNYFLLDMGSVGDYVDRQDNKTNPIRKARHMYSSVYAPPTK